MNTLRVPSEKPPLRRNSSAIRALVDVEPAGSSRPSLVPPSEASSAPSSRPGSRGTFRRVVSAMHVVGVIRADVEDRRSTLALRKDMSDTATKSGAAENTQNDRMRVGCIRIRPEWVLDPAGNKFFYWLSVVSLAIIYNSVIVIPRAVFQELDEGDFVAPLLVLDYLSDLLYIIDIFMRMMCGYLDEGVIVTDPRLLAKHYLRTKGAVIDILSIVPTDLALPATGLEIPYPIVRINRVLKFHRFSEFFNRLESRTKFPDFIRMVNLMLTFITLLHWNACLYYGISVIKGLGSDSWVYPGDSNFTMPNGTFYPPGVRRNFTHDTLFQKYVYSYYWALQTVTLIGQIQQPKFTSELLFVTVNFLFGVIVYAYIVGNVSRTIMNMNAAMDAFRNRMDDIKQYMTMRKIDDSLQERVVRYFEYQWTNQHFANDSKVLACLPDKLEAELALRVHLDTLKRVQIFQDVEPGLLADLVLKLKLQVYSPGDFICRKGDIGKEMYIVKKGKLEVVADNGLTVFATLKEGSIFGEISILNIVGIKTGNRRTANVRSVGYSDLFCLSKEALWDALKEYPEAKKKMLAVGKRMLLKDGLLDEEVAANAELRQNRFIDKIEKVENDVDELMMRFGRLVAEKRSTMKKMKLRVDRMREIVRARKEFLRANGVEL